MIGIMIVSHGKLAEGFKDAITMIAGKQPKLEVVSLQSGDNMDEFKQRIGACIRSLDDGSGCWVFTDLFGASPANSSAYWMENKVQVIAGVNLAIILEALGMRETTCNFESASSLIEAGKDAMVSLNAFFPEKAG